MKIYLSGPVTGTEDAKERFANAEKALLASGHEVINPLSICECMPESTTWAEYMDITLAAMKRADAVYMMKGWERSHGATIEYHYAVGAGMTVYYDVLRCTTMYYEFSKEEK